MDDMVRDVAELRRDCQDLVRSFRQLRRMMELLVVLTTILFLRVFGRL